MIWLDFFISINIYTCKSTRALFTTLRKCFSCVIMVCINYLKLQKPKKVFHRFLRLDVERIVKLVIYCLRFIPVYEASLNDKSWFRKLSEMHRITKVLISVSVSLSFITHKLLLRCKIHLIKYSRRHHALPQEARSAWQETLKSVK